MSMGTAKRFRCRWQFRWWEGSVDNAIEKRGASGIWQRRIWPCWSVGIGDELGFAIGGKVLMAAREGLVSVRYRQYQHNVRSYASCSDDLGRTFQSRRWTWELYCGRLD
jgi:hypothetical protein